MRAEVKVFGLPRSGTNYLRWLIDRNFDARADKVDGWEHALPDERWRNYHQNDLPTTVAALTAQMPRVCVYKDFDNWARSIERNPAAKEQMGKRRPGRLRDVYDEFRCAWAAHGAHLVRYESFLMDFCAALDYLATLIGVEARAYEQPERVAESPDWRPEHRRRYV